MKKGFFLINTLIAFCAFSQQDSVVMKYAETITSEELSEHLHILASDEYEGRETGRKGQKMAADYIKAFYDSKGIPPLGESYFQSFPIEVKQTIDASLTMNGSEYKFLEDFYLFPGDYERISSDNILFLGYGIDDKNYSDYKEKEVEGKVLLVLSGEPMSKGKRICEKEGWTSNYRLKRNVAKEKGAKALLVIDETLKENVKKYEHFITKASTKLLDENKETEKDMLMAYVSADMANKAFSRNKTSIKKLSKGINKTKQTKNFVLGSPFEFEMKVKQERLSGENVLGFIEGTDKKEELIIITAHYDHIGKEGEEVYNGADDDGSGTVTVLEIAEAFAQAKKEGHGPRRSVLCMPVSGEEKGLLGSRYYTEHPAWPLEQTVCDLNIDMVGRIDEKHEGNPNYVYLIGSDRLSTTLHQVSEEANKTYTNIELDYTFNDPQDPNRFYYRSDHYNFAKNNIPVIFYFNGVHEDYHQLTDTVDKINFDKIENIAKLVFYTAWELANREERITVDVKEEEKNKTGK